MAYLLTMIHYERKFSLSNDRVTALELLRLQEAAQLVNDQLTNRSGFTRNDKLSHLVHAVLNASQFVSQIRTIFYSFE